MYQIVGHPVSILFPLEYRCIVKNDRIQYAKGRTKAARVLSFPFATNIPIPKTEEADSIRTCSLALFCQ